MGVLQFDGVNDQLKWTTLAAALADVTDGAWTVAALLKISDVSHFNGISYLLSGAGAGTAEAGMSHSSSTNGVVIDVDTGLVFPDGADLTVNTVYLVALSKGAGSATPRVMVQAGSAGSPAHFDSTSGTMPDQADAAQIQVGTWQDTDFFEGWIGLVGWWEGAMSDANKEALDNSWQTSDWWNSAHGQPVFLVELNVAAGSVVDLAGNVSSSSHTGTTLDAAETLDSWNFNGTGAVAAGAPYRETYLRRSRRTTW